LLRNILKSKGSKYLFAVFSILAHTLLFPGEVLQACFTGTTSKFLAILSRSVANSVSRFTHCWPLSWSNYHARLFSPP